jgi:hypothetical protein
VFAFRSAEDPGKTVLIINSNPTVRPPVQLAPTVITSPEFHPGAVYRVNVDTDGDAQADVAFTFTFSAAENGVQTGTCYYATGAQARQPGPVGEVLTALLPVSFDAAAEPSRPTGSGCTPGRAASRSSPTLREPCTASSGRGTTTSPATTSCRSRLRCPTTS